MQQLVRWRKSSLNYVSLIVVKIRDTNLALIAPANILESFRYMKLMKYVNALSNSLAV